MGRRRADIDREIDEEIRFHIEMRTAANVAAGMEPGAARRDAELRFGDQARVREAGRADLGNATRGRRRGVGGLTDTLLQDLRIGYRSLARNRLATAAAVMSLALGIGATSAVFSVVYGLLFRQLPFEHADRLLFVDAWNPDRGDGDRPLTWADVAALRDMEAFDAVGGFIDRSFTITAGDTPERIAGAAVTPELFDMLGVTPREGRSFRAGEGAEPGFEQVAIISDALWQRLFAGDPGAVGRTIHLNGRELVIVGIMPPGFRFPETEDLWLPLGSNDPTDHQRRTLIGIARLAPGTSVDAARAQVAAWTDRVQREFPRTHAGWDTRVQWFRNGFVDQQARQSMYLMLAAVGFVLLLACANVANLLLARAAERVRDMVVRSALGAGRSRLARQVLTESLLLGLCGGAFGAVVAWAWVALMERSIPEEMAYWISIRLDTTVLLYTVAISVGTGVLFGMLPALQASRAGAEGLAAGGRAVAGARGHWRGALVTAEVALSVLLLASAVLMMRSSFELQSADPGFEEERLLSLRIVQAGDQYDDPAARFEYFRSVGAQLSALPGVERAVATSAIPADDGGSPVAVLPEGATEDEELFATAIVSMDGLFETLGIAPLAGRTFTEAEAGDPASGVVVLGAGLAERLWPGADAVDRSIVLPDVGTFRIIGVVSDLQYEEFGEDGPSTRLQLHVPYALSGSSRGMSILVRTRDDPAPVSDAVRRELARIDPTLAPFDLMTMSERRAFTTWPQRLIGMAFAAFGVIAVALALCGIYGVIAYSVAQRTREIGVRIALGARPLQLLFRVVGGAMRLAGAGALLGLLGALAFTRALAGVLYGVSVNDPRLYVAVLAAMLGAAALAAYLPARRAARVDPTEALRAQ